MVTIKKSKSRKRPYVATFDGVELEPVGGCRPWVVKRAALRALDGAWWGLSEHRVNKGGTSGTWWQSLKFNNREIKVNYAHK